MASMAPSLVLNATPHSGSSTFTHKLRGIKLVPQHHWDDFIVQINNKFSPQTTTIDITPYFFFFFERKCVFIHFHKKSLKSQLHLSSLRCTDEDCSWQSKCVCVFVYVHFSLRQWCISAIHKCAPTFHSNEI